MDTKRLVWLLGAVMIECPMSHCLPTAHGRGAAFSFIFGSILPVDSSKVPTKLRHVNPVSKMYERSQMYWPAPDSFCRPASTSFWMIPAFALCTSVNGVIHPVVNVLAEPSGSAAMVSIMVLKEGEKAMVANVHDPPDTVEIVFTLFRSVPTDTGVAGVDADVEADAEVEAEAGEEEGVEAGVEVEGGALGAPATAMRPEKSPALTATARKPPPSNARARCCGGATPAVPAGAPAAAPFAVLLLALPLAVFSPPLGKLGDTIALGPDIASLVMSAVPAAAAPAVDAPPGAVATSATARTSAQNATTPTVAASRRLPVQLPPVRGRCSSSRAVLMLEACGRARIEILIVSGIDAEVGAP